MKLVVQIPCHNEEESILRVLEDIPVKFDGIDEIKIFVIDDGSCDKTSETAENFGVDKIIKFNTKQGLSKVFYKGVQEALKEGADILVNIDGDNQYSAKDIQKLIKPILDNSCDIAIGVRPIDKIKTFSFFKKILQKFGSFMVKIISDTDIKDATSGFRAFNRNALLHLNIFNNFTYTIESIIQAKNKNLKIKNVDICVNEQKGRKSRLFKNNFDYIFKQSKTMIRFFIIYQPFKFFIIFSVIFFTLGLILGLRFLSYGTGHIQSLILCAIFLILSFICTTVAIIGDLCSINRKLLEDIQFEIRQNKYKK